jgi:hypothetical protein
MANGIKKRPVRLFIGHFAYEIISSFIRGVDEWLAVFVSRAFCWSWVALSSARRTSAFDHLGAGLREEGGA